LSGERDDIVVCSHVGHCGKQTGKAHCLEDQFQHKLALVDYLCGGLGDSNDSDSTEIGVAPASKAEPLVLMGHSIGSQICLRVLAHRRGTAPIACVVNLFPTFRNLYDGLVPGVKVAITPGVRQVVANLLHYSPLWLRRYLLSGSSAMTDEARYATAEKISYDFVNNILYMAYTEGYDVVNIHPEIDALFKSLNTSWISSDVPEVIFLYGRTDAYTPLAFIDDLKRDYAHLSSAIHLADVGVPHAFVLSHSRSVARQLQQLLPQRLARD
jgi:pimeloyl-ACP methyl ester carboxylesterase